MSETSVSPAARRALVSFFTAFVLFFAVGGMAFHWIVNRWYVEPGESLLIRYRGPLLSSMFFGSPKTAPPGQWAAEGEIGVLQKMRGPGRHFYCPIWYECERIPDKVIQPGEVGIVTCNLGDPLPPGQFLVDGDIGATKHKGILRKALGPGRYRINPYGYELKKVKLERKEAGSQPKFSGWVEIPIGYVGVVTNLADNPDAKEKAGIQDKVLPPGIYPVNGAEKQIDIVEIGYREATVAVAKLLNDDGTLRVDEAGEPLVGESDGGINFPSSDGFPIVMDFTAIWGIMPDQAPHAIRTFGNVAEVESKVVLPQIESICRNNGSNYSAVQLLVGEQREGFQDSTLAQFQKILLEKQITLLYGLVRHIYIPREVRQPIQTAFIADELKLTREQEQTTAMEEGKMREAERMVELEAQRIHVETQKKVAQVLAEGHKKVGETEAETRKLVAAIAKQSAQLEADAQLAMGEAENQGKRLIQEATASRFRLAVEAFGTADAYNNWTFATELPESIDLKLLYAGEGTLWTDMDNLGVRANLPLGSKDARDGGVTPNSGAVTVPSAGGANPPTKTPAIKATSGNTGSRSN